MIPNTQGTGMSDATRILFTAAETNNLELAQEAIAAGADVSATNEYGETPLHVYLERGCVTGVNIELVTLLAKDNNNINSLDAGEAPIHHAAYRGDIDVFKVLRKNGADLHAITEYGDTVVHFLIRGALRGRIGMLTQTLGSLAPRASLPEHGLEVFEDMLANINNGGHTPLDLAVLAVGSNQNDAEYQDRLSRAQDIAAHLAKLCKEIGRVDVNTKALELALGEDIEDGKVLGCLLENGADHASLSADNREKLEQFLAKRNLDNVEQFLQGRKEAADKKAEGRARPRPSNTGAGTPNTAPSTSTGGYVGMVLGAIGVVALGCMAAYMCGITLASLGLTKAVQAVASLALAGGYIGHQTEKYLTSRSAGSDRGEL